MSFGLGVINCKTICLTQLPPAIGLLGRVNPNCSVLPLVPSRNASLVRLPPLHSVKSKVLHGKLTKLKSSLGAVIRVRRSVTETETEAIASKMPLPMRLPPDGALAFTNAHVAIRACSGSGKISLILNLLQMMEEREGKIELDGIDVSTLVPAELRSRFKFVSQYFFLMPGNVHFDIDSLGACLDDADISWALEKLAVVISSETKATWIRSLGIDAESLTQSIVDTEFGGCTVLAVMHLPAHVALNNRVALIGDGELLESGEPYFLIFDEGKFSELHRLNRNLSENSPLRLD
ncbi:Putative P-loop containing nucleoside triphosphate hydrolase [Colletotrichum destructivum]|uniref:P-loop containing nucleoside triphosphate hydrolase n=1 Tax=Colletotrichum destructivum TaxID=34406 RepID=A0AAX4IWC4_9PEZI|nr:Putative P-loop containing nucleoside triphosphate hydrolase [Colletotrichum destructivum]